MAGSLPGAQLRQWRQARHLSQLQLALSVQLSQRHLSFVESGRAQPSRALILRVSEMLEIPLRARNEILLAAGLAPQYFERALTSPNLSLVHQALSRLLNHHEPYPAMVLDGGWNILMRNAATEKIFQECVATDGLVEMSADRQLNFMRMMCSPSALRPHIRSWSQTGRALLARLRREALAAPGSSVDTLLNELLAIDAFPELSNVVEEFEEPTIALEIDVKGETLRLLTTTTTFGTPQDVTLQELRIEMSFPADELSEQILRRLPQR